MSSENFAVDWQQVARAIDHTLLKPEATRAAIEKLCREAIQYGFWSVCVQPCNVKPARAVLAGSGVKVASVMSFPHGANQTSAKRDEAAGLVAAGADELDMVINIGALKSGDADYVRQDIAAVTAVAHPAGALLKVIIETALLTDAEKKLACELAVAAGADFIKTSTGFNGGGATVADVRLMCVAVAGRARVKASGGIRTAADAVAMLAAGAARLGTSGSIEIVRQLSTR
jgi:deoxyribose-phosphate aldolase